MWKGSVVVATVWLCFFSQKGLEYDFWLQSNILKGHKMAYSTTTHVSFDDGSWKGITGWLGGVW